MFKCVFCNKSMTKEEAKRNYRSCYNCAKKKKDEEEQERQKKEEERLKELLSEDQERQKKEEERLKELLSEAGKHIRGGVVSSDGKHIHFRDANGKLCSKPNV